MKQIDLEPDGYKFRGKDSRWYRRDDPKTLVTTAIMGCIVLGGIYWYRNDLIANPALLIGVTAIISACIGGAIALLLKDVY